MLVEFGLVEQQGDDYGDRIAQDRPAFLPSVPGGPGIGIPVDGEREDEVAKPCPPGLDTLDASCRTSAERTC